MSKDLLYCTGARKIEVYSDTCSSKLDYMLECTGTPIAVYWITYFSVLEHLWFTRTPVVRVLEHLYCTGIPL